MTLNDDGMRLLAPADAEAMARSFDLMHLPDGFVDDPYPIYHALRMHAPVRIMPDGSVFPTRHDDLERVYKHTTTFSSDKHAEFKPKFGDGSLFEHHTTSLVFNDPPLHTRVRRIIAGALTPRAIAAMEAPVTMLVDRLLDDMAIKAKAGASVDLIDDFAAAIREALPDTSAEAVAARRTRVQRHTWHDKAVEVLAMLHEEDAV